MLDSSDRPRLPRWAKVSAVLAVLAVLAGTNLAARERQRRLDARTSDVVAATVVVTADAASLRPGSVTLTVSLTNNGQRLQVHLPRVDASGFRLDPIGRLPSHAASGSTVLLRLQLHAVCRGEREVPPRLVVPVVPRSGAVHEVTAAVVPDLYALACGLPNPADAAQPTVTDVHLETYSVVFRLTVRNASAHRFTLTGLAGQGLVLSPVGGLPIDIQPAHTADLRVRLAIPSCAQLPDPLDEQRVDSLRFGEFELELADVAGRPSSLPYLTNPEDDLYRVIRALAHRICPRRSF